MLVKAALNVLRGSRQKIRGVMTKATTASWRRMRRRLKATELMGQTEIRMTGTANCVVALSPLEKQVEVETNGIANRRQSLARRLQKCGGMASGVILHSDWKELLGRIECDK